MSYLKFDRASLTNLDESLQKEILRANSKGGYSCSTILGCNTRKYHGMLVVPSSMQLAERWVLLSSIDETVIQYGAEFNLAVHKYSDGTFSPSGHKYVREFDVERATTIVYRVGGVVLEKKLLLSSTSNSLIIRYKLLDAHSRTILRFKPLLAFRKTKELTYENNQVDWSYQEEENGISMCLYAGAPRLFMQFSKPVTYSHAPHWNKNLYYDKEAEREHNCIEDLPVPGVFECEIKRGEEVYCSVSDTVISPSDIQLHFEDGESRIIPRDSFVNCLKGAVGQYYFTPVEGKSYLQAGFPWFNIRHRDQMIGLTAASFGIDKPERYKAVMDTALAAIWRYYDEGVEDEIITGLDQPDALLWLINCIQDYSRWVGIERTRQEYGDTIKKALHIIRSGKVAQMRVMENGLLYAIPERMDKPVTWMDATIDGYPVVDRQGYIVEFNALWYNALCFNRDLFEIKDLQENDFIERVSESFIRVFVNEHDYLFDYVAEGREKDWSVRPNQILAAGLSYSPLSRRLQRSILDIVTKELLTPKGLRSLSPISGFYRGYCGGSNNERAYAYLQGGVWSWLVYYYMSAYLKLFRRVGVSFVDRILIPFEDEMKRHGISNISEVYDGTPPYVGRSAISFMLSVTALLRIKNRLDEFKESESDDIFDLRLSLTSHHKSSPDAGLETSGRE